ATLVGRVDVDHSGVKSAQGVASAVDIRDGGDVGLSDSSILSRQPGVSAVSIDGDASVFTLNRGQIAAAGEGAVALAGSGGYAFLTAVDLHGNAAAIRAVGPGAGMLRVDLSGGSRATGAIESGRASLQVRAEDSDLLGDVRRMGEGALDVTLTRSRWVGRGDAVGSIALDESAWSPTGDSSVGRLSMAGHARIAFDDAAGFSQLRIGQLDNPDNEGAIDLRARLDGGGALARQATDRVLVDGDVIGITTLTVTAAGGDGGATVPGSGGGISVAQVGGMAAAESFRLAGDYVAVGPWRYGLRAYAPGEADASQRLVEGAGDGYWDYRLQSTRVDATGEGHDGLGQPTDGGSPRPAESRAALVPQVPTYLVLAGALFGYGRTAMDAMHMDALGASRDVAVRVRTLGGGASYRSTLPFARFGFDYTRSDRGLQLGADLLSAESDTTRMRSGVVASVGGSRITPRAVDGVSHARVASRGLALTYVMTSDVGWHVDAAYGFAQHRVDVRTAARGEVLARLRANGRDALLGGGFHWSPRNRWDIDPGVSLLWQRLRFASAMDAEGIAVRMQSPERVTLRAGTRASLTFEPHATHLNAWSTYVDARYVASRDSGARTDLSRARFATGRGGRAVELAAGASVELRSDVTLFADVNRRMRIGGAGESGLAARLGAAMTF
ncbi:MAG: autotransporter outer membrane beta-barrel domain-containing protein, partial [Luteibacter sp.]